MQKTQLVSAVAKASGESRDTVEKVLNALTDAVIDAVAANDAVKIAGFGQFKPVIRAQREGRNPRTGESVTIAERRTMKFQVSDLVTSRLSSR